MRIKAFFAPLARASRAVFQPSAAARPRRATPSTLPRSDSAEGISDFFVAKRDAAVARYVGQVRALGREPRAADVRKLARTVVRAEHAALNSALIARAKADVAHTRATVSYKRALLDYQRAARASGKFGKAALVERDKVWAAHLAKKDAADALLFASLAVPSVY